MHDFHFASPRSVHYVRQSLKPGLRRATARTGQLLNLTDIARDLGVAVNTIRAWLSVLEAAWQVVSVRLSRGAVVLWRLWSRGGVLRRGPTGRGFVSNSCAGA